MARNKQKKLPSPPAPLPQGEGVRRPGEGELNAPDCTECGWKMPELDNGLQTYFECFCQCDSQYRPGYGYIGGLDWNVVIRVAEVNGLEIDSGFFRALKIFESEMLKEVNNSGREI